VAKNHEKKLMFKGFRGQKMMCAKEEEEDWALLPQNLNL
jgi:hypothetical protein